MRIILSIFLFFALASSCFAQENEPISDRIIGGTFKNLAKAFIATNDINQLKEKNIAKINKMDESKFRKRYSEVYVIIKDLPPSLKARYGITEGMTKTQVIQDMRRQDKQKLYELVDAVPDSLIAKQFKQYLSQQKSGLNASGRVEQVHQFWKKILKKVGGGQSGGQAASSSGGTELR